MSRFGLAVVGALLVTAPAFGDELSCEGPFAKASDHERLIGTFGRANVIQKTVHDPEGMEVKASIVFPKDPTRRLVVIWGDEAALRRPARIDLAGSGWSGPKGLRIGTPLAAVQTANTRPFVLYGFGWDFGGTVESWNGGVLGNLSGGCMFVPRFAPDPAASEEALSSVTGDEEFRSDLPEMRATKPKIKSLHMSYPDQ